MNINFLFGFVTYKIITNGVSATDIELVEGLELKIPGVSPDTPSYVVSVPEPPPDPEENEGNNTQEEEENDDAPVEEESVIGDDEETAGEDIPSV